MLYRAVRPLLFALDPERAHGVSLGSLDILARLGAASLAASPAPRMLVRVMGLDFPNPVGLAAGLDKDGRHIDGLGALGFGFLEIGAVTPRAQPGNARPRLFRLPEAEALINRLGFNNDGVEALTENIHRSRYRGILGVLILVGDIWAIITIFQSTVSNEKKLIWTIAVVLLPLLGLILWFFLGPRGGKA